MWNCAASSLRQRGTNAANTLTKYGHFHIQRPVQSSSSLIDRYLALLHINEPRFLLH